MTLIASQFSHQRYVLLCSFLPVSIARVLYDYSLDLVKRIQWQSDTLVPHTPALYAETRMEELLVTLLPRIEEASGLRLYPTYSYLRVYKRGDVLAMHRDRPSCEISLSMNLGYEADAPWPLWIEGPAGISSIRMELGDALLYRGTECVHWRDAFSGENAAQLFLHYVDQNGPNAEWKFDKRPRLRVPESSSIFTSGQTRGSADVIC